VFLVSKNKTGMFWLLLASLCCSFSVQAEIPALYRPVKALNSHDLAVIVNDQDPLSLQIANYYQQQRHIPDEQMVHISFSPNRAILSKLEFQTLKQQVDAQTPKHVQAFALTWMQPFRVECMSITTAFATGFDPAFCAAPCAETRKSPYYAAEIDQPYKTLAWRPTMMLAGKTFADVKALIDTGVAADYAQPQGSAYLLKTSDNARSSRAALFPDIAEKFKRFWQVKYLEQDYIAGESDVMFYFTGHKQVPYLADNHYLPGAVADHLTSKGGVLSGTDQMSVVEWLKAGVTASYGAVIEPCNFPAKFSNPALLMYFYLRGSTVLEAYWKSVAEPGQGIFVGEPLAKPFAYPPRNLTELPGITSMDMELVTPQLRK
jgi:uncharacterized protein (TIGR03790 family)